MNLSGKKLGDYELHDLIGTGGMGAVYRGYHRALNREVAVKVIHFGVNSAELQARFTREAQTAANLEHAHIVRIYHYGVEQDINYIVMQYLPGASLAERLELAANQQRQPISLSETAALLGNLASALDYAHSEGVVHRDIKPQNIMFNKRGQAYIVDFGIAKLLNGETNLTGPRLAMGTANFMPPEQWASEELTGAADQYALAVTAFQLVTQRLPFEADSPLQVMHKHKYDQPTPIAYFRSDLPESLQQVIEKALAKEAADRYESCSAFAEEFAAAAAGIEKTKTGFFTFPVAAPPPLAPGSRTPTPEPMPVGSTAYPAPVAQARPANNSWLRSAAFGVGLLAVAALIVGVFTASRGQSGSDATLTAVNATMAAMLVVTEATAADGEAVSDADIKSGAANMSGARGASATPSPTLTDTPAPTATDTATDTATPTITLSPTTQPSETPTDAPESAAVLVTPSATETPEPTTTPTLTETASPSETPIPPTTLPAPTSAPSATLIPAPSETPVPTDLPQAIATETPKPTLDATATVASIAISGVARNGDWPVVEREIGGVPMVLVPAGCFEMGSDGGEPNEAPVHPVCFDTPYWIDKTEVTQGQFEALGGVKSAPNRFSGESLPVETVTWFEARNFCVLRGGSLPTEAQWEYAARGPENWDYPWGDDPNNQTVKIGEITPTGGSWIGAQGMGGNVWEWTSSQFAPYPYDFNDGRETLNGDAVRVSRGGANSLSATFHSAYRIGVEPAYTSEVFGFRCALRFDGWDGSAAIPGGVPLTITVIVPSVNLRGGPGTQYNVVGSASMGDMFPLIAQSGGWYLIQLDSERRAWLSGELVDVINPGGASIEFALTVPAAPAVQPTDPPSQPPQNNNNPGNPGSPNNPTSTPRPGKPTPPVLSTIPPTDPPIYHTPTDPPFATPPSCGPEICMPEP